MYPVDLAEQTETVCGGLGPDLDGRLPVVIDQNENLNEDERNAGVDDATGLAIEGQTRLRSDSAILDAVLDPGGEGADLSLGELKRIQDEEQAVLVRF